MTAIDKSEDEVVEVWEEDFRTIYIPWGDEEPKPFQTFRGVIIDRCGFVIWQERLMRPYEILREERWQHHDHDTDTPAG